MSIATVVTRGFGNGTFAGSVAEVVTRGFRIGDETPAGAPGGTFRRPAWSWTRVFSRGAWDRVFGRFAWGRVWRYEPVSSPRIPPKTLTMPLSESRWFAVSFAECPEVRAGEELSSPELLPPGGVSGLTITDLAVTEADFDGVPEGEAVEFFVEASAMGTYDFAIRATAEGGGKPVVACRLVVTADFLGRC